MQITLKYTQKLRNKKKCSARPEFINLSLTLSQLFKVTLVRSLIMKRPIVQFPKIQAHLKLLLKSSSFKC